MGSGNTELLTNYKYDHQGRLLTEKLKLNNDTEITLVANEYGDLGELASKYLHGTAASEKYNQKTDYKYNIKGWLTNINEVNNLGKKLFGLTLYYADGTNGFYNGNIWKSDWQNNGTSPKRYTFDYDWASRLKTANYADGTGFTSNPGAFNTQYTYDKNGNLKTLKRYKAGDFIDDLVYTYPTGTTGSNQLQSVSDNGTTGVKDLGYKSGAQNYSYDGNGNMKEDHNGVDFGYNFLNLPQTMVYNLYNTIGYTYSSTGVKLQKKVVSGTTGNKVVDYIVPFLYEDSDLKVIFTSAGRIVKNVDGSTVLWKYEYNLTDHLGNVRAVFAAHSNGIPELMQHTDYYPFGMVMNQQETFNLEEVKNRYLYNEKELQDDNIGISLDWYDYGARMYDPQLGRWHTPDPLSEKYDCFSPYHFSGNNPILYLDENGMDYWSTNDPDQIARFLSSMQSGQGGFSSFDYKGWNHATDAEFTGNLTYNDESNMFYSSYGTIRNSEATRVGISIPGIVNSDNGGVGFLSEAGANWLERSSGRTGTPLIDPIDIVAGGLGGLKALFARGFTRSIVKTGTTVLGKNPDYIYLASELGARRINIPAHIWNRMTSAEQWAANVKFLDRMIARGDKIVLSNRVTDINKVTGAFREELNYLISKGYRFSSDGLQMIK